MKTLTLRSVPDEVVDRIVAASKEAHQSMNAATIQALKRAFGLEVSPKRKRDLSKIAGTWTKREFDAFEKATRRFDRIDAEVWKK